MIKKGFDKNVGGGVKNVDIFIDLSWQLWRQREAAPWGEDGR
jgi:hypothetical protein